MLLREWWRANSLKNEASPGTMHGSALAKARECPLDRGRFAFLPIPEATWSMMEKAELMDDSGQ